MTKKYTLELTAEELAELQAKATPIAIISSHRSTTLERKLEALDVQSRADREADELRLPWRARKYDNDPRWVVLPRDFTQFCFERNERAAKLMSAANEWKQAAIKLHGALYATSSASADEGRRLFEKAKRKEETGIPED